MYAAVYRVIHAHTQLRVASDANHLDLLCQHFFKSMKAIIKCYYTTVELYLPDEPTPEALIYLYHLTLHTTNMSLYVALLLIYIHLYIETYTVGLKIIAKAFNLDERNFRYSIVWHAINNYQIIHAITNSSTYSITANYLQSQISVDTYQKYLFSSQSDVARVSLARSDRDAFGVMAWDRSASTTNANTSCFPRLGAPLPAQENSSHAQRDSVQDAPSQPNLSHEILAQQQPDPCYVSRTKRPNTRSAVSGISSCTLEFHSSPEQLVAATSGRQSSSQYVLPRSSSRNKRNQDTNTVVLPNRKRPAKAKAVRK